ncbi:histidine kinase dimerization/phospho-acceptor domain-containing protein [Paraburkholderia sp. RL18-103-BIB-C]|jgi:signal transduction histidine kinase|uniref:histidine kinase dimerization/phospho-acceptor domain-containing protein n=1 Tax=unclassified Paraburkholderia TaxID=2615204 RepID=UPI0038B92A75
MTLIYSGQTRRRAIDAVVFTDLNATVQTYRTVRGIVLSQPARCSDLQRQIALTMQALVSYRRFVHRDLKGAIWGKNISVHPTSFRWSVSARDERHADGREEIIEGAPRQSTVVAFNASRPVGDHAGAPKLKNQVLAMVAHELRAPLTPLQFATQLIRRASADRPEVLRSLDMIDRQIANIARLAEDLMDVTRTYRDVLRICQDHGAKRVVSADTASHN